MDRYHQVLEQVAAGQVRDDLEATGAWLAARLAEVQGICMRSQEVAPSSGDDLPGGHGGVLLDVHRALTRSATLAAQAGEAGALAVVALRAGRPEEAASRAGAARRAVDQTGALVERASDLLRAVPDDRGP